MRFHILLFCLLFLLLPGAVHANATRTISAEQWQQLTSDKAFSYKNDVEKVKVVKPEEPGIVQQMLRALFGLFAGGAVSILLLIIVLGIIVYIIWQLFFSKDAFVFGKAQKKLGENTEQNDEDIAATNWEALLQQARNNNDMRLAVRYSYMWLLQLLQQRELIQYRIDKTNYEYAAELDETDYKQPFRQLSRQYEYAWYGQLSLSDTAYNQYTELFNNVKKQLGA